MIRLTISFGSTRDKRQQLLYKHNKKIIQLGRYLFINSFIRAFFHSLQQTNVACEELSVKLTMDFPSLPLHPPLIPSNNVSLPPETTFIQFIIISTWLLLLLFLLILLHALHLSQDTLSTSSSSSNCCYTGSLYPL